VPRAATRIRDLAAPRFAPTVRPGQFAGYVDDYVAELRLELGNLRSIGYPPSQRRRLEDDQRLDVMLAGAERDPLDFSPRIFDPVRLALRAVGLAACGP
jgi:hypothetical protein